MDLDAGVLNGYRLDLEVVAIAVVVVLVLAPWSPGPGLVGGRGGGGR